MNLQIREFSQSIINFVNQSQLPMEVKRIALLDILRQVETEANEVIRSEIEARNKAEKTQQKKETNENDGGVA